MHIASEVEENLFTIGKFHTGRMILRDPSFHLITDFFGAPGEIPADSVGGSKMPVLVVRDRFTKGIFTHLVPCTGTEHFYPEAALLRDVKFLGYSRLVIKSDQEPSILALANAVKNTVTSNGIDCQLESSPKGDSHGMSNGEAESVVGITQGLARTLKDFVEHKSGKVTDPKSPLLGWLIEHVGLCILCMPTTRMQRTDLLHTGRSKEEIGTLHYHHLGNVFITVLGLPTSWMFDGTLVCFLVFVYILLRRSLVPQKVWLWFNLFEESLKTSNGMWSYDSLFKVHHGHQTHQLLEVHEKHWNCQSHWLFQLNSQMLHQKIRRQHLTKHISNVYIFDRTISAGCKACAFIRQGLDRQGIPHDEDCRTRIAQRLQETEYGRKRIEIARKKEEDFKSEPEKKQRIEAPEIRPSISASGSGVKRRAEDAPDDPRLVPEVSEEARGTKRSADELDDMETEVTNLLLAQRRGFLGALRTDTTTVRPVCEDDLGIDAEAPQYWDNISGKPLSTEKVEEARSEERSVINQMQVWEVIDRPSNEKIIPTCIWFITLLSSDLASSTFSVESGFPRGTTRT